MAVQVRIDLTPSEFDLLRAALDVYRSMMWERGENEDGQPVERRSAKAETLRTDDLLKKLEG